ncbi:putative telomere silencing protein Zds1 [Aspergillus stella-maris]|uniref:putative telomere silencing protein Zds1 n=1 Tax=Aspergillus stella-maris TaxID=1810926 RepID=UPI003CCC9DE3
MQASASPPEAGGGYSTRRGHGTQLSISDPSHHVTEAIGHMYDDDYDKRESRRLSYISSPLSEAISIVPQSRPADSSQTLQVQSGPDGGQQRPPNGQPQPPMTRKMSSDDSPTSPGASDTATTSFPLNDIDYESDPAAVAQELNNLAAIRRMSMDVTATGDPDLPSFNFPVPSIAPSPSADENDTSRLFWVPASLHPELAPKEFKSFLESKSEHIKRRSGDFSTLSPERQNSNSSLTRKRSMLSKQIDSGSGYTDGAERLERKRSQTREPQGPNLHEIENLVGETTPKTPSPVALLDQVQSLHISTEDDRPILPPAPPGHSLRRSTRTQYRKAGSLRKGERPSIGRRAGRPSDTKDGLDSIVSPTGREPLLGLTRVSTDPTPSVTRAQNLNKSQQAQESTSPTSADLDSTDDSQQPKEGSLGQPLADSGNRVNTPQQPRQWDSRTGTNGRQDQNIPEIVETPPADAHTTPSNLSQPSNIPPRVSSHDPPKQHKSDKRSPTSRSHKESSATLNDFANNPQALPGNSTRTDNLSFIPTLTEDRKSESKKGKDKKDSEGGRKSSWHWFLGSEDKDKEKEKKKDSDSKKIKSKLVDKVHDATNVLPAANEPTQRRESNVFDRHDSKLEEERKKDSVRRSSAETKKEKEKDTGLFSSIFGGGRKKNSDHHHKKSLSRTLSPEPPARILQADIDYPWTRFSILEERAIYRMAHIKLANPRRALYSQVLLSNFMYSYLAKVQQMHPHMMLASSAQQRQQQKAQQQVEEYQQYQRYQEAQDQQYGDSSYDDPQMYDYGDDSHHYQQDPRGKHQGYDNGYGYGQGHNQYGHMSYGDDAQLDDDDDDMW